MFIDTDPLVRLKNKLTGNTPAASPPAGATPGLFDYNAAEPGAVPGGTQVAQTYLQGKNAYGKALAQYNQQRTATAQGFGYQGDIDPNTGLMTNLRVDQTNPYGGYQLDRRAHAEQWDALRQQQAGRRIGGKGLGAQAQSDARFSWGGEDAAHAQDFIGKLSGIDQQQQQAYQGWQDTYWQALTQATRDAIEQERWDQAMYAGASDEYGGSDAAYDVPVAGAKPPVKGASMTPIIKAMSTPAAKKALAGRNAVSAAQAKKAAPKPAPVKTPSTTLTPAKTAALNAAVKAAAKKKK